MNEVQQIAYWVPVSAELLRGPTDQERAEYQRRAEEREAAQRAQLVEHAHRMTSVHGVRRAVLELHGPALDATYAYPVCRGCDFGGYDAEPPEWPCRTYELVRDAS